MAGIEEALERLVTDASFRRELSDDPRTALAGYTLTEADLELLSTQLADGAGGAGPVEQRTSKSALFALLAGALDVGVQDGTSNTVMLGETHPAGADADAGQPGGPAPGGPVPIPYPNVAGGEDAAAPQFSYPGVYVQEVPSGAGDVGGDPDNPLVVGSAHNPSDDPVPGNDAAVEELTIVSEGLDLEGPGLSPEGAAEGIPPDGGADDVPTQTKSLNYAKMEGDDGAETDGIAIRQMQEISGDAPPEALADPGPTDPGGDDAGAAEDVVLKGSKILQNAVPDPGEDEGIEGSDARTSGYVASEPIGDLPDDD